MLETVKGNSPGIGFTWIIQLLIGILSKIIPLVTPTLKAEMELVILGLYDKARETPNPWDDFLIKFLMRILSIEVPEGE